MDNIIAVLMSYNINDRWNGFNVIIPAHMMDVPLTSPYRRPRTFTDMYTTFGKHPDYARYPCSYEYTPLSEYLGVSGVNTLSQFSKTF